MESIGLITKPKPPIKKFYIPDSKKQFYFTRSPVRVWSADFMDKTNDELVENFIKAVEDCLKNSK